MVSTNGNLIKVSICIPPQKNFENDIALNYILLIKVAPFECPKKEIGGCFYQSFPIEHQLKIKTDNLNQVFN